MLRMGLQIMFSLPHSAWTSRWREVRVAATNIPSSLLVRPFRKMR